MIKYNINLIDKHFNNLVNLFSEFPIFSSFLIAKIFFSDKENGLTIILIIEEIIVEYNICGRW